MTDPYATLATLALQDLARRKAAERSWAADEVDRLEPGGPLPIIEGAWARAMDEEARPAAEFSRIVAELLKRPPLP